MFQLSMLSLQTAATVALAVLAYIQIWGRKPVLIPKCIIFSADDDYPGCFRLTIECDLWNRRTTPIRVDKIELSFESANLRETPRHYAAPDGTAYASDRLLQNVKAIVGPSGHMRLSVEHVVKMRPIRELDWPFVATAHIYDPSLGRKLQLRARRKAASSPEAAWRDMSTSGVPQDRYVPGEHIEALWQLSLLQPRKQPQKSRDPKA